MRLALAKLLWIACAIAPAATAATIALDVGHYQEKPGATSARGRPEFEFNLDLTHEIEVALRARGHTAQIIGADGAMRSLWRRARAAEGTDLFVSVHHDSTRGKFQATWAYEGVEQRYSDRFAGFSLFVSRENPAWRQGMHCASAIGAALLRAGFKPSLYHADPVVGENRPFADKANGVHYFDHLAVLRRAAMPALLFEAGVIVNRDEEMRMRDSAVRERIAAGVADGIEACLKTMKGERSTKETLVSSVTPAHAGVHALEPAGFRLAPE
jgi:N-acetylmuramoyl-L-alanine amidase